MAGIELSVSILVACVEVSSPELCISDVKVRKGVATPSAEQPDEEEDETVDLNEMVLDKVRAASPCLLCWALSHTSGALNGWLGTVTALHFWGCHGLHFQPATGESHGPAF